MTDHLVICDELIEVGAELAQKLQDIIGEAEEACGDSSCCEDLRQLVARWETLYARLEQWLAADEAQE